MNYLCDIIISMTERELVKKFVNKADFTEQGIDEFLSTFNISKFKLVELLLEELFNVSGRLERINLKTSVYFSKLIKAVTILFKNQI